ncbi:hypothetical protein CMV_025537 [Castanea mollissima]|uniref:Uncharacterized protein n=1 Tax=Castanea mollissima TaxID=60419 RepID=A0A8J4QEA9_9ROSI|nr:hypothetical protein CMV_025537 [Castanea mollissima]
MGANEKRSFSVSAMAILVLLRVFNTNHIKATSLSVQFNFINNSSTYHCVNASMHECLADKGIDPEFLMDTETRRMLAYSPEYQSYTALEDTKTASCGRGRSYKSCSPDANCPSPYNRNC